MIIISDQLNLSNILTLEPRESNVIYVGANIKVESQVEYLARVDYYNRYLGLEVYMLEPPGEYTTSDFLNFIDLESISYKKFGFVHNLMDFEQIAVGQVINVIDSLVSESSTDALSAKQGKVLKGLVDSISIVESDPIFSNWLISTPPAYVGDIPTALLDLTEDSTHRVITDLERAAFHSHSNKVALDNVSGINTGDNAINTLYSGLVTSKQNTLQSGINIKTINNEPILGSGNITIVGGGGGGDVIGPGIAINNNIVFFNGTTGTLIKDSGLTISGSNTGDETNSSIRTKLGITTLSGSNTGDQNLTGLVPYTGATANLNLGVYDLFADKISIGTNNTTYKLDVKGTTSNDIISSDIGFNIYPVPDPTTPTGVVSAGGSVESGFHIYNVSYTTAIGETHTKSSATINVTGGNTVTLTIPVSTDPRVTGRKIYRNKAGGAAWVDYLLATIADNTTTTYVDTVSDTTLTGTSGVGFYRPNTTTKNITVGGVKALTLDTKGTIVGISAGDAITSSGSCVLVGYLAGLRLISGSYHTILGEGAGSYLTTSGGNVLIGESAGCKQNGGDNTAVGWRCLGYTTVATQNTAYTTAIGSNAGHNLTGNYNTLIGYYAANSVTTSQYGTFLGGWAARFLGDAVTSYVGTGNGNTFIGYDTRAFTNADTNETVIGYQATGVGSNSISLGNASITKLAVGATEVFYQPLKSGSAGTLGQALVSTGASTSPSWQNVPVISSGTAAPATTPTKVGDIYVDTTNKKLYFATGIASSADWTIAN